MHHRKRDHTEVVQNCREQNGNCQFGKMKCWFKHIEVEDMCRNSNNENDDKQDIIGKLFDMVEKFTTRIVELENKTNDGLIA